MEEALFKDYGRIVIRTPLYSHLSLFGKHNKTKNLEEIVRFYPEDPAYPRERLKRKVRTDRGLLHQIKSQIHMSINRWFVSQQRLMEYTTYLFGAKYYNQILDQSMKNNSKHFFCPDKPGIYG